MVRSPFFDAAAVISGLLCCTAAVALIALAAVRLIRNRGQQD